MKQIWVIASVAALAACSQAPDAPAAENGEGAEAVADEPTEVSADVATLTQAAPAAELIPAVCTAEETPIFACIVEGGKRLSVCGSNEGAVQYRFGDESGAELVLDGGAWASVPYSGGGEAQIKFESGDTDYIVFSRVVRTNFEPGEPNNPAISDGVVVLKEGAQIAKLACDAGELKPIDYNAAEKLLPQESKLFSLIEL